MRPDSKYTAAVADFILGKLAEGLSLKEICREYRDQAPVDEKTVRTWAIDDVEGFGARYTKAREVGYHSMADEIFDIADDSRNDWMERRNARTGETDIVVNHDNINRSRLMVDTRKWFLSKVLPKIYGDKLALTGADGGAVQTVQRIERVIVDPSVTPEVEAPPY